MCHVPVVQWLERSSLKRMDLIPRVRIPLVLFQICLFKPLFTRCISTSQVSCLNRVVVRAFDSKCLELSIPDLNPAITFNAGGYGRIQLYLTLNAFELLKKL